jgi:hypothetical protein
MFELINNAVNFTIVGGQRENSINMFIFNSLTISSNINMSLPGLANNYIDNNINLTLKGNYFESINNSINMFIKKIESESVFFTLKTIEGTSVNNFNMYLNSNLVIDNSVDMMTSGIGVNTSNIELYTHGF